MKNLVSSILFAAVASQAAGCIIVSDDTQPIDDLGDISISWALKSTNQAGDTIPAGCPVGSDTATLFALPQGADPSNAFSDSYDCIDGAGLIADLEPGTYIVWVQLTDHAGTTKFAESGSQIIQVVSGLSTPAAYDIYVDRGFFLAGWNLVRGGATSCAAVQNGGVSILATVSGGANGFETLVNCEEGEGRKTITEPIPSALGGARYTVAISLLNRANPPQSIGDAAPLANKSLDYGNELEDLGIVQINVR